VNWVERRREWTIRDHSVRRSGIEWSHPSGYRLEYAGHRATYRWVVVYDKHNNVVASPNAHSRFWIGEIDEVAHQVTEMLLEDWKSETLGESDLEDLVTLTRLQNVVQHHARIRGYSSSQRWHFE
jgi:hypothetical protein